MSHTHNAWEYDTDTTLTHQRLHVRTVPCIIDVHLHYSAHCVDTRSNVLNMRCELQTNHIVWTRTVLRATKNALTEIVTTQVFVTPT